MNEIAIILQNWGKNNSIVKTIYIYGSRARDDFRPDSDIDIAIDIDIVDYQDRLNEWIHNKRRWKAELESLIPYNIDLDWNDGINTPIIDQGIKRSSILVYLKNKM